MQIGRNKQAPQLTGVTPPTPGAAQKGQVSGGGTLGVHSARLLNDADPSPAAVMPTGGGFLGAHSKGMSDSRDGVGSLATRDATILSTPGTGGKSNTDLLRPKVAKVFEEKYASESAKDDFPFISLETHLTELAESVAALKDQQLAPASADKAKKELFIQLAREKFADHREQLKANEQVKSLVDYQEALSKKVAGKSTAHARSSAAAFEHYNALLALEELPARIRSAKSECVDVIAEQAISKALRQAERS